LEGILEKIGLTAREGDGEGEKMDVDQGSGVLGTMAGGGGWWKRWIGG
jgi:hypothetical protein